MHRFLKIFFLFGLFFWICPYNGQFLEGESSEVSGDISYGSKSKEISFDLISAFTFNKAKNSFAHHTTKLMGTKDGGFDIHKKNKKLTHIDFSDFEGPGFSVYSYQSKKDKALEIIIIEGQADIGTAWYYAVVLKNENLADQFYINEPRSNSETTDIKDFISISLENKTLVFKFNKEKIAGYSSVSEDLKSDNQYLYLEKKIK
ncbi:hypothetical protein [Chryseobacterium sp. JUb7]|uniref:hypothetical protein n=1 Tax=Chryseobacterium sp. JUb7 TaxID=2940599 RepID=UPI002168BBA1|nr:hypothetical protein [Chryseobacterium sp. JUb7]MCS3529774.1 hypothetical protein [Chryseobacterium sp. JUb7]